jgi:hypothetical protein
VLAKQGNRHGPAVKVAEFGMADSVALIWLLGITETMSGVRSIETILVKVLKREGHKYGHVFVNLGQNRGPGAHRQWILSQHKRDLCPNFPSL